MGGVEGARGTFLMRISRRQAGVFFHRFYFRPLVVLRLLNCICMQDFRLFLALLIAACFGYAIGLLHGCNKSEQASEPAKVVRDTVVLRSTENKTVVRYVQRTDTAVLIQRDTITDTVFITLPVEHKTYCDTIKEDSAELRFRVDFHGWRAGVDSVRLDYEVRPLIIEIEKRRGFGQFVGMGVGIGGGVGVCGVQPILTPTIGVHFVYGFGYHF